MAACELCRRVRSTRRARETTTSKRAIFFLTASRSTRRLRARRVGRLRRVGQRRAAPLRVRPSYASAHRAVLVHEQGDAVGRQRRLHWPVTTDPIRSNAHHRHVAHRTLLRTYAPGGRGTHLAWAHAAVHTAVCSQDAPSGAFESAHGRPSPPPRPQVFGDLMALVESWEHPVDPSLRLFYSAAWDWRRDLYEQSVRVADKVAQIRDDTGCRPIVAGHSFGARLVHTALARGDLELSGEVAGVMYFAGAFLGTTYLGPGKSPLATCVRARNTAHAKVQEQCSSSHRLHMVTTPPVVSGLVSSLRAAACRRALHVQAQHHGFPGGAAPANMERGLRGRARGAAGRVRQHGRATVKCHGRVHGHGDNGAWLPCANSTRERLISGNSSMHDLRVEAR